VSENKQFNRPPRPSSARRFQGQRQASRWRPWTLQRQLCIVLRTSNFKRSHKHRNMPKIVLSQTTISKIF